MKTSTSPALHSIHRRAFLRLTARNLTLATLAPLAVGRLLAQSADRKLPPDDGRLRIICFGAHPDDCELQASGTGALWAAQGHHVKFVSVTNGDIGHWRE